MERLIKPRGLRARGAAARGHLSLGINALALKKRRNFYRRAIH